MLHLLGARTDKLFLEISSINNKDTTVYVMFTAFAVGITYPFYGHYA